MTRTDPLGPLHVIRKLTVGPLRLRANRVSARYTVAMRGSNRSRHIDFIYRFEEAVFHPDNAHSENLAAILAAQPAINYGLFADHIHFIGPYDVLDRRFLCDMADNTAREIYVKKFLEPNPFLVGPAASLPVVRRTSYLHAKVTIDSRKPIWEVRPRHEVPTVKPDPRRATVLSSGGKESLLSFGLLSELARGKPGLVHPVFVNESGRHWFTALNAYRSFARNCPETARVWTNSDRVYGFMNRLLPFVRADYASLRADEYPIQLWTLAIFLFGTLPIAMKRGTGRIIVGDEYDTTRRTNLKGIQHYDGVFDQSRFFDEALTRYFNRKGWNFHVLSLLRPLSEMLVQKILVERYPDLQRDQVSCHAAHLAGGRVRPCGRCEKCRRVAGMLAGVGADPRRCGYSAAQIDENLANFATGGLHQEGGVSQHVAFLLARAGLIDPAGYDPALIRRVPDVERLRFDPLASPRALLPPDLRRALLPIYRTYTNRSASTRTDRPGSIKSHFLQV